MKYIGRFAPTPSGPLHFGSLVAALASFLDARANAGLWLLRIEDIDIPRCSPEATQQIFKTLERFHLFWDSDVLYQSQRTRIYQVFLDELNQLKTTYHCYCSRKDILAASSAGHFHGVYPGTCRNLTHRLDKPSAIRFRSQPGKINFDDRVCGHCEILTEEGVGDFVLYRADGYFAYHLAVVIDDALQNVSHIVRGRDLLASTPHHVLLQKIFNFHTPSYAHIPLVYNREGQKLSKQNLAQSVENDNPTKTILQALNFLNQDISDFSKDDEIDNVLEEAIKRWNISNLVLND